MSDVGEFVLRDYQDGAVKALHTEWDAGGTRIAVVLPTGAGKTVCFAELVKRYVADNSGKRVLILAHSDELIEQAASKVRRNAPHLRIGIVKGARNEVNAQVVVVSVQSLRTERRRQALRRVGLIIIDECHHAVKGNTYGKILAHYGAFDDEPKVKVAGFTATLARGDAQSLADVWEKVAYKKDILFMIKRGYLLDVRGAAVEVPDLDLRAVKKSGKDFQADSLGDAIVESMAPELIAKAYADKASDRSGVMFAPNVASAYTLAEAMNNAGISCEVVHGSLLKTERRAIIDRLNNGTTQVVANCMVLTEGFDSPRVSCVVIARPTRSAPLYQQMVGRALRVDPDRPREGQDALILDVVGAGRRHDLRSLVDLTTEALPVREGQSLLEAEEEAEEEKEAKANREEDPYFGPVVYREFDPLARASKRVWSTTEGGTRFLTAGTELFVFILPNADEPEAWDVLWATKVGGREGRGGMTEHVRLELSDAMEQAEALADEMGGMKASFNRKGGDWRREKPSPGAISTARQERITVDPSWNAGELSEAIDRVRGSKRIDPVVAAINAQRA